MPWVTKDGERKFEPRLPKPEITPPDPKAPWPDVEGAERLRRERAAFWAWWKRHVAEYCEIYRDCPRAACRRSKACEGPGAPCHDEAFELLKAHVYPEIKKALREQPPDVEPSGGEPPAGSVPQTPSAAAILPVGDHVIVKTPRRKQ
jgi:hypothetical protein